MPARDLDWDQASQGRELTVPLSWQMDGAWTAAFVEARKHVLARRRADGRERVEITMDNNLVTISEMPEGEDEEVKRDLQEIVDLANEAFLTSRLRAKLEAGTPYAIAAVYVRPIRANDQDRDTWLVLVSDGVSTAEARVSLSGSETAKLVDPIGPEAVERVVEEKAVRFPADARLAGFRASGEVVLKGEDFTV